MPDLPPGGQSPGPGRRRATALHYAPGATAPTVTATGAGHVAERIIAAAREAGVPVREDPALADALASLELGGHVPAELWRAVAETLAWAYRLGAGGPGRGPDTSG